METPEAVTDLQGLAVPLLLNLDPQAFAETDRHSAAGRNFRQRLNRLHQEIEAGSPRPEFELQLDPLGVVAPALKPFAGNSALEEEPAAHFARSHDCASFSRSRIRRRSAPSIARR